jgi:cytochrome c-type protein NapC
MQDSSAETRRKGWLARIWGAMWRPSRKLALATLLIIGGVGGVLLWGGFNWAMEASNTEAFCVSCHEMRDYAYKELKETVHFANRSGVRATCPDCHVPKQWQHKLVRKVQATNELFHHITGTIDTPEKFEADRLTLARHVWDSMKSTDSRECRNCHLAESMDRDTQNRLAQRMHRLAVERKQTCVECHQGIAHKLPKGWNEASGN